MFLNSHRLVPVETFHETELIICVCVEVVSIKKRVKNQCENVLGNRKMTRQLQNKTEIQFAKHSSSKWLPTDQISHFIQPF